jgi:hypothetical protein
MKFHDQPNISEQMYQYLYLSNTYRKNLWKYVSWFVKFATEFSWILADALPTPYICFAVIRYRYFRLS